MATDYLIQRGDTLGSIARKLGTTVSDLAKANNIADPNKIYAGRKLVFPGTSSEVEQPVMRELPTPDPIVQQDFQVNPGSRPLAQPSLPEANNVQQTPKSPSTTDLFNKTLQEMLKAAQGTNNNDLMEKRNAIIQARFNVSRETTPEALRVLSPQAQSSLRNLDVSGLEDQLGGINVALQGRESKFKAEQDARQNALDILFKQQQFEEEQKQAEAERKALEARQEAPIEIDGNLLQKQSDGSYKVIYSAPTAGGKPIEVSPGASLYDPETGEFIGTAPITNTEKDLPADIREYEYAVKQGYKGTLYDYKNPSGTTSGKPPTEAEKRAFTFYSRGSDAKNAIDGLDDYIANLGIKGQLQLKAPNFLQTNEGQQYNQARTQFVEAYLRKDSGAAISPSEYAAADRTYFVQPGDTSDTIARKKMAREKILNTLKTESGKAYTDSYGEETRNKDSLDDILNSLESFNQPLSTGVNGSLGGRTGSQLGALSQKYESSGNPGAIGYDSTGGYSYGKYQLAHQSAKTFIDSSPFKSSFQGLTFNSPQWRNKWKEVAQKYPDQFSKAQEDYVAQKWYEPLAKKVVQTGLNLAKYSPTLKSVIFSTAVQHGAGTDVINKALAKVGPNPSEASLIRAIYNERWSGGKRFASSTPAVKQSVYNRFFGKNGELNTALSLLS